MHKLVMIKFKSELIISLDSTKTCLFRFAYSTPTPCTRGLTYPEGQEEQ